MVHILIFEDSEDDLIRRYSEIASRYDVYVKCTSEPWISEHLDLDKLENAGFKRTNVQEIDLGVGFKSLDLSKLQDFDLYLLDGLGGECFTIINQLPREKCYIHTSSWDLQDKAEEQGYQLLRGSIDYLLR